MRLRQYIPEQDSQEICEWVNTDETVVLLSKKHVNPKAYVEIGVDAEEYYKIKGE